MPRNGAGVFAVLNPILIGALRSSSAVNGDCTDAGAAITDTLPADGQAGMTGPFKAADGSAPLPSIAFAQDIRLGFRRSGSGEFRWVGQGIDRVYVDVNGKLWHLGNMDIAGAIAQHGAMTGPASDPILISEFVANGAARRIGNPVWTPEPWPMQMEFTHGGLSTILATGVICDMQCPVAGTIVAGALAADQTGSCVVDVWKVPYASYPAVVGNSITGGNPLTISNGVGLLDNTLSGWSKTVAAGDCFRFNLNSNSAITRLSVTLSIQRFT